MHCHNERHQKQIDTTNRSHLGFITRNNSMHLIRVPAGSRNPPVFFRYTPIIRVYLFLAKHSPSQRHINQGSACTLPKVQLISGKDRFSPRNRRGSGRAHRARGLNNERRARFLLVCHYVNTRIFEPSVKARHTHTKAHRTVRSFLQLSRNSNRKLHVPGQTVCFFA